ncbi:hypothetical protein LMG28140_00942 [Paraburkholderia metrosideri]|uniref:Transposase n=1 Tax=Paraburkholderia metrosideri TaxID=580937 RepID=A0ABM8NCK4_9BURK|nr:hypothetical protein LMG28140_00942 [Paraburkholderia metrosideri]
MRFHVCHAFQTQIRERADSQRNTEVNEAFHKSHIPDASYTVVNAFDTQRIKRFYNVFGRSLFSRVSNASQALASGTSKNSTER